MTKATKVVLAGVGGLIGGYLLAFLAGFAKLLSLGKSPWEGYVQILFVPVMYIKNTADGFVARTAYGVFVIAALGSVLAIAAVLYRLRHRAL